MADQTLKLYDYQRDGVAFLTCRKLALLCFEMGLGKTPTAIKAAEAFPSSPVTIICPAIAKTNWQREIAKWRLPNSIKYHIYSYSKLPTQADVVGHTLIIDEAHFIKNKDAKRTQSILAHPHGLVHAAKRVWCLTGTPMPNHAGELWPLLRTFNVTNLSYNAFVQEYCTGYSHAFGHSPRPTFVITGTRMDKLDELRKLLTPVMLYKSQEEAKVSLPPLSFATYSVPANKDVSFSIENEALLPILREELRQLNESYYTAAKNGELMALEVLKGMANSISTLRRYMGLQKAKHTAELITHEILDGQYKKIVVFYHHKQVKDALINSIETASKKKILNSKHIFTIEGGQSETMRWHLIDGFNRATNEEPAIMLAQIQAASTAISLTASNQVIFIEQSWVPGDNAQAVKRCHRHGQLLPVFCRNIFLENDALDESIVNALTRKQREISLLLLKGEFINEHPNYS